ncbi:MAG: AgmX/PglI C-terminal domain-containing protein [Deltaproteobacteria bacterium]|nr:AgmX/PglI C-terminal domain-containing protein [Deltaproteobacteria bacterium]
MSAFSPAIREFLSAPEDARRLGPYRCKELLDKAGRAPVYRAVEEHAGHPIREVAVKVFDIGKPKIGAPAPAPGKKDDSWQARVVDEARTLCRVQHPNVIRFHTLSTDPKRGLMGLVMEFAEGISVDRQIASIPSGDDRRIALALEVGLDISAALAAAHEAGVVHCNVKPSNIMFTNGTYKLINFGIAASLEANETAEDSKRGTLSTDDLPEDIIGERASRLDIEPAPAVKKAVPIAGTVGYIDPVCLETTSQPIAVSDLYSLGATLYEVLTGEVPSLAATKRSGGKTVDKDILTGKKRATPVAELEPNVPADLAKLVDSLVAQTRDERPRRADAVLRSFERIRSVLAGRNRALPPEDRGPFPGLERYEEGDRDVFFGRAAEIAGVLELARTRGLVGIVGLSGSGKSSITRAGILPAIEEGALGGWPSKYRSVLVTPGKDPMGALDAALAKVLDSPLAKHPEAVTQQLAADVDAKGEGIVILVDQLEEVVTKHEPGNDKSRLAALDLLSRLAEAQAGIRVIIAIRSDLLDGVLAIDPHFSRALTRGIQLLGPLTHGAWEEVVDRSLEAYGYDFEDASLRKDVLADLKGRESAMTLVQFGLTKLWAARDAAKKKITKAAFTGKGGMKGALEEHANAAIEAKKVPKDVLRNVLLAMTTPEGTRTNIELEPLVSRYGEQAKDAIFALTKARLVVSEKDGFTFVHDSVLKEWGLLRGWVEDARADRELVAHIERDATRWEASRDPAELWRKGRLAAALDLWKAGVTPLSDSARRFLAAGAKAEQKAQLGRWAVVFLILTMIVGGALVYAKISRDAADQARKDAAALAAALAEVKTLKQQAEENAAEAAVTAKLLAELQKKIQEDQAAYGAKVAATMKKVASATSLDGAQKASEELKAPAPTANVAIPLPAELAGGGGPKIDTSGPSPSGGGGTFDQGAIERVVNSRKAGVKRTCLERSASTASSTKVTATITIAPNGSVQNVTSAGDDPSVAKCIENQLRTWSFPAPGETKTVQIPFVFVRQ